MWKCREGEIRGACRCVHRGRERQPCVTGPGKSGTEKWISRQVTAIERLDQHINVLADGLSDHEGCEKQKVAGFKNVSQSKLWHQLVLREKLYSWWVKVTGTA